MFITASGWEPGDWNPPDQWPADFESAASTNSARLPYQGLYVVMLPTSALLPFELRTNGVQLGFNLVVAAIEMLEA